jgi:uncharacterized protein (DUF302 family)
VEKSDARAMIAAPTIANELRLKVLAWQDEDENVWLSYNTPEHVQERHDYTLN